MRRRLLGLAFVDPAAIVVIAAGCDPDGTTFAQAIAWTLGIEEAEEYGLVMSATA